MVMVLGMVLVPVLVMVMVLVLVLDMVMVFVVISVWIICPKSCHRRQALDQCCGFKHIKFGADPRFWPNLDLDPDPWLWYEFRKKIF